MGNEKNIRMRRADWSQSWGKGSDMELVWLVKSCSESVSITALFYTVLSFQNWISVSIYFQHFVRYIFQYKHTGEILGM